MIRFYNYKLFYIKIFNTIKFNIKNKMFHISKLIFIILIISINSKEENINLNIGEKVTKTLIETEEPIYYNIKLNEEIK